MLTFLNIKLLNFNVGEIELKTVGYRGSKALQKLEITPTTTDPFVTTP
jgi:hypothetical protein